MDLSPITLPLVEISVTKIESDKETLTRGGQSSSAVIVPQSKYTYLILTNYFLSYFKPHVKDCFIPSNDILRKSVRESTLGGNLLIYLDRFHSRSSNSNSEGR